VGTKEEEGKVSEVPKEQKGQIGLVGGPGSEKGVLCKMVEGRGVKCSRERLR
jgi:hypothetical protein